MSKLFLFLAAAVVVYFVLRGMMRRNGDRTRPPKVEQMVPCAHCGVNLPRSEALESNGRFYCSDEHRRLSG